MILRYLKGRREELSNKFKIASLEEKQEIIIIQSEIQKQIDLFEEKETVDEIIHVLNDFIKIQTNEEVITALRKVLFTIKMISHKK
jgi:succinate dehydrogenase/fumarate reductase flavoprotein subunit